MGKKREEGREGDALGGGGGGWGDFFVSNLPVNLQRGKDAYFFFSCSFLGKRYTQRRGLKKKKKEVLVREKKNPFHYNDPDCWNVPKGERGRGEKKKKTNRPNVPFFNFGGGVRGGEKGRRGSGLTTFYFLSPTNFRVWILQRRKEKKRGGATTKEFK